MKIEKAQTVSNDLRLLIEEAREALENNKPADAVASLKKGEAAFGNHEKFCFEYGYALYELGDFAQAEKQLRASIKLDPNNRPQKYFTLAQISDDKTAKQLYHKGLELTAARLTELSSQGHTEDAKAEKEKELKRPAAQALCALAQLEEKLIETGHANQFNEKEFMEYLSKAALVFPNYLETYFLTAMYNFNCQNEHLFKISIQTMINRITAMEETEDEELDEWGCDFFLPLVRLLIDCQMWAEAAKILEVALGNDGSNIEAGYLYAFSLFYMEKYAESDDVLEKLKELRIEESGDQELIEGYLELRKSVAEKRPFEPLVADMNGDDEDWQSDDQDA